MKIAPPDVKRQPVLGPHVLQEDMPLFRQAVDLHQFIDNKISYCYDFDYAVSQGYSDPHAYALEKVQAPWRTTSRQLYHLHPAATDSRMPRYGYK